MAHQCITVGIPPLTFVFKFRWIANASSIHFSQNQVFPLSEWTRLTSFLSDLYLYSTVGDRTALILHVLVIGHTEAVMNEREFYVPFGALLGYIGTATPERDKTKDDSPLRHTLAGCEPKLVSNNTLLVWHASSVATVK